MDDESGKMINSDSIQDIQSKVDEIGPPDPTFDMKEFADETWSDV